VRRWAKDRDMPWLRQREAEFSKERELVLHGEYSKED
jgi:hypothetical protein